MRWFCTRRLNLYRIPNSRYRIVHDGVVGGERGIGDVGAQASVCDGGIDSEW